MAIHIRTHSLQGITVAEISGRITLGAESAELRDGVKKLIDSGHTQLVLSLGGVDFIDSSGLGTLISLLGAAQKAGGKLKLARVTPRTHELLVLTKLLTVFDKLYDDEASAVASFGAAAKA